MVAVDLWHGVTAVADFFLGFSVKSIWRFQKRVKGCGRLWNECECLAPPRAEEDTPRLQWISPQSVWPAWGRSPCSCSQLCLDPSSSTKLSSFTVRAHQQLCMSFPFLSQGYMVFPVVEWSSITKLFIYFMSWYISLKMVVYILILHLLKWSYF